MQAPNGHDEIGNPYAAPQSELRSLPQVVLPQQVPWRLNWKLTVLAWLVFFGGFTVICATEYTLRNVFGLDSLKNPSGIGELIWFALHGYLAICSLYLLWFSTAEYQNEWKRYLIVGVQGAIAFVLYLYLCLIYVVYSGIDSL